MALQVHRQQTCTGVGVGQGSMAWEVQVVPGTEPVALEHIQEEREPHVSQLKTCRLYAANDRLGQGMALGGVIYVIARFLKMSV